MFKTFFEGSTTEVLYNTKNPCTHQEVETLQGLPLANHVWLQTSGTTTKKKWVALSRDAIFFSATAVNQHLQASKEDVWCLPLPSFHVGGLGVYARAYLTGSNVIPFTGKWDPVQFVQNVNQATLTSLVPTQVYDLVSKNLFCPKSLRACIVGGGNLSSSLYYKAKALGWPLLPSYGLTECASQVATAKSVNLPELCPLKHVDVKVDEEGNLWIQSASLLSAYFIEGELIDPKHEGWFRTEDKATLLEGTLEVLGRGDDFVKILGESVSLPCLQNLLDGVRLALNLHFETVLFSMPDPRQGNRLHLATTAKEAAFIQPLLATYDEMVLPFQRISNVVFLKAIPKSPLNKVLKEKLRALCV